MFHRIWIVLGLGWLRLCSFAEIETAPVNYRGWEGAIKVSNEAVEIVVVPQTGRLVHLSKPGGENLFRFDETLVGQLPPEEEGNWLNYGGDWLWAVHQGSWGEMDGNEWPPLRLLDRAHWFSDVERMDDGNVVIRLRRDIGVPVFARVERRFELAPGNVAELRVHQSIHRIQASKIPVNLWQISQIKSADLVIMGNHGDDFDGKGYKHLNFDQDHGDFLEQCDRALVYHAGKKGEHKLGTLGNWIAARKGDHLLLLSAEGGTGQGGVPDFGCQVVMYSNFGLGYSEIETQSAEVVLAPGEILSNTVSYRLLDVDPAASGCEIVDRLAEFLPARSFVEFSPSMPHPADQISLRIRNAESGGFLHWGVNSPDGNWELPAQVYWPAGSRLAANGKAVETPLPAPVDGFSSLALGPFDQADQVVTSVHAALRWGKRWESNEGENFNVAIMPHPDAAEVQWIIPGEALKSGKIKIGVGSTPAADKISMYLDGTELANAQADVLVHEVDASGWAYGPHDIKVRLLRGGHLSTGSKRIWKIPQLETVGDLAPGTAYGATKTGEGNWQVVLFAPNARFVELEWQAGTLAPEKQLMKKTADGHWVGNIPSNDPFLAYRYILNGEKGFADPWSKDVRWETPAGKASHLPEHAWTLLNTLSSPLGPWQAPDPKTWVIYELHIPDVAPPGSFQGLQDRLDYIQLLGVNAIEPLPVTAFPGEESWGYNPAFHMAIERSYGTPDEFRAMILAARERGIAYVADLVLNHIDADAPLNRMMGEPEENPYTMPFAQFNWGFPKLDQQDPALKRYIKDTIEHWVTTWGVDGFRYDATQWVKWSGYKAWGASWMSYVVEQADPQVIQIAENLPSEPDMIKGTELDSEWDGHFRWRMRKVLTEGKIEEPEKMREILDPRNHAYINGYQRVPYIESHDEERFVRELLEKGFSTSEAFTRHHAAAAVMLTVPGMPMLYAGQEWGEMTAKVVGSNPLQWQLREQPARAEMLEKFKALIALRVGHAALHSDRIDLLHLNEKTGTFAYLRPGIPESILVAVNVSKEGQLLELDVAGEVVEEIHQQAAAVNLKRLTLRPGQARVFRIRHPQELR